MNRVAHIIGNGDNASLYKPQKGLKITCNIPPMAVDNVYSTCMVDFKMMKAVSSGSVVVPGNWTLGYRPKKFCEMNPEFHMKCAGQIRGFYLTKPSYVANYTDFNCGHLATHYAANGLSADEVHLYGFDSLFDHNMRSCTDTYLVSDRGRMNNQRLIDNWRPIWQKLFAEFPDTQFILHHKHNNIKLTLPSNVDIFVK
jgi:hypothetical protein